MSVVVSLSVVVEVVEEPLSLLLLQEIMVRLKRDMRIMYKTLFIFSFTRNERIKVIKSHIHILESETLSRESRVTESAEEINN